MISDCDEIPRLHLLPVALEDGVIVTYIQKLYYFNFNTHAPDRPWPGTRACRVADARALSPHVIRNGMGQTDAHYPRHVHIMNAGWHFSYFGGVDSIQTKMTGVLTSRACHTREHHAGRHRRPSQRAGVDIWGREHEQEFVIGAADDLPYTVLRDLPKYAPHFADGWQPSSTRTGTRRAGALHGSWRSTRRRARLWRSGAGRGAARSRWRRW
jgi:hypothetical protein